MPKWFDQKTAGNGGLANPRRVWSVRQPTDRPAAGNGNVNGLDGGLGVEPGFSPIAETDQDLSFPDAPRLALEQLIGQLTDRAQDVLAAQGRLRGLLRANAAVVEELSLPAVLRHVVEGARELVHARYGAVGVIGPDGDLEQFIHVGMDDDVVDRIGDLPTAHGILGLLIKHPNPVRLTDLRAHPAAVGFPDGHPPMTSFLGVPIRVRGQVVGNLYLADSTRGEFNDDDEQLVTALAGTAGAAIANARLYEQTLQQRRWRDASSELTQALLAHSAEPPLDLLVRLVMHATSADMAMFSTPVSGHAGRVEAAAGMLVDRVGQIFRLDQSLAGRVIRSGTAASVGDGAAGSGNDADDLPDGVGAVIGVRLPGPDATVRGALVVAHTGTRAHFTDNDRDQLVRFAVHAGAVLDLERAREDRATLLQIEDHDRIAADLHDHVIQELFATGMGLQGLVSQLTQPAHRVRVLRYIDTLDDTIRTIRNSIYQLNTAPQKPALTVRLIAILTEQTDTTGLAVATEFGGHLDQLPATLDDDIIAVLRESVSNTVRHAGASAISVKLTLLDNVVTLEVTDNGVGIGHPTRSSGLANMRRRAENHAGAMRHSTPPGGGTRLTWTAHRPHPDAPHEAA